MSFSIRPIREQEIPALEQTLGYGFGGDPNPESHEHFTATLELERTRCAFDGESLVASLGVYSAQLTVPGGSIPVAGTTMVSVRATHRRRGLLRSLMREHLAEVRAREEPLAGLWASEAGIYSRFGYGPAAQACGMSIERAHGAFLEPLAPMGCVQLVDAEQALKLFPRVYERVRPERPGLLSRSAPWWQHHRLADPSSDRGGASAYRHAVYEEGNELRGYLLYRVKPSWPAHGNAANQLQIVELQAVDGTALAALWRYALDVDLNREVVAWNQPVDDPLPWLLQDPRRVRRSLRDSLWLRVVDLPRALEGRRYAQPGRVCLQVADPDCPWNRGVFELEAAENEVRCRPTRRSAELKLGISELGALYLGGASFQTLARAGRLEGEAEALRRADALFSWSPAPWCPEIF